MPTYEIEQYEIHVQKYRVEADNEAKAIAKAFDGDAEPVDGSLEYIEIGEDLGLPTDDHRDLAEELRQLGVPVGEAVIPSIRSVVQVDADAIAEEQRRDEKRGLYPQYDDPAN